MAFYNESLGLRILETLNFPVVERCLELSQLFDPCSLRELQDIFPKLLQSIFGFDGNGIGWGLRTNSKEVSPHCFDVLYRFFAPAGPMFHLCYRLLNDGIKFEFSLDMLPNKVTEMLQTGQYSIFYADLVNVDNFRRQVTSLYLNAFDYYILHFAIHATFPLHKMYPAALQVHNERTKTVYFFLTAEYLCTFLPANPSSDILPNNICMAVKAPQPMPIQTMQPRRSPKYLKIPNLFTNNSTAAVVAGQSMRSSESPRANAWRTESILNFFVDVWLRYDVEDARDLPSSEFVRIVRLLVKQIHAFSNSAHLDETSMATLRKISLPMMKARIYSFLKSIIARWPLDSSLSVVLELWLSYIQPWRYTHINQNRSPSQMDVSINSRYDNFIVENLVVYTQIFVHFLPRFERLDFTTFRNTLMLYRFMKVFCQSTLPEKICQAEKAYTGSNLSFGPTQKHTNYSRHNSSAGGCDWDSSLQEEVYTPIFGPTMQMEIEQFLKTVYISRLYVQQEIESIRLKIAQNQKSQGVLKRLYSYLFDDVSPADSKLNEIAKIPDLLDLVLRSLGAVFNVDVPEVSVEEIQPREDIHQTDMNCSLLDESDQMDLSKVNPMQMMNNRANIKANSTIDPAMFPIEEHECTILVRFLHRVSCKINEMFGSHFQSLWNRSDFWGKLARLILTPPMTTQWFDKPRGVNELCEEQLPARLCLRPLGSYKSMAAIALAMIVGYLMWGSPTCGLLTLILLVFVYFLIAAIFL